ncbi:Retrovirus-related Pol polyprotein from type-2 retrotransposable element R2DM; Endonuclease [Eumeta japonica]|uniref:Retrovirus-related Pol polyprotein from type-2 retrotransposable element R2DM Endonuclease n=1 Tax=Eumeta variegata TaxID=151549 RepID=A0A4C1YY44_EUMVA|nr:Retrovirus-related Pol polyprotein from type-2 retrotransposable element R2DM; Endonuclease [Eumeta japonica]
MAALATPCENGHYGVITNKIDLEKAYNRVKRNDLWRTLYVHGRSSGLIQALQSLYRSASACVKVIGTYTDWFDIHRSVRQRCVASPWLFNLFMDSCLQDLKEYECRLRMNELSLKCYLYADDQVILAPSACGL